MSIDGVHPTLFEKLPIEIFREIFDFFPLCELITTFYDLNFYINSIIRSTTNVTHAARYNDASAINLLSLFPSQINRLIIVNVQIADFTSLSNLQSLTLKYGTQEQFNSIRPQHFPMLEILHIKGLHTTFSGNTDTINDLFRVIFSNGFSRLRICMASDIGKLAFHNKWTGSLSLRTVNLTMETEDDYERLRSICPHLRRLTKYQTSMDGILTGTNSRGQQRHIFDALRKLEQLEAENKFIIDINYLALFGNTEPPSRFNRTKTRQRCETSVVRGRILPQTDPYSRASFLVEIKLAQEYPFRSPEVVFLDPLYHLNITHYVEQCYCSTSITDDQWMPNKTLIDLIRDIIHIIDGEPGVRHYNDFERFLEYKNNYLKLHENVLELTLSYGRPRY